jgi:BMFP domain-containing protein YqiC
LIILFGLAVEKQQVENALGYIQSILAPSQQRLRLDVEAAFRAMLEVDPANHDLVIRLGREAVEKAKEAGYL